MSRVSKFIQEIIDKLAPHEDYTVQQWKLVASKYAGDIDDAQFKIGQEVELVLDLTTGMPYTMFGKRGKVLGVHWCQLGPDDGEYEYAVDCYPKLVWEFELCEVE